MATVEQARDQVADVRAALLSVEAAANASGDQATINRLHRLHVLLRDSVVMLADHFDAPVSTFSGGEDKPPPGP